MQARVINSNSFEVLLTDEDFHILGIEDDVNPLASIRVQQLLNHLIPQIACALNFNIYNVPLDVCGYPVPSGYIIRISKEQEQKESYKHTPNSDLFIYKFNNFENIITASKKIKSNSQIKSTLCKDKNAYYLLVKIQANYLKNIKHLFIEYGEEIQANPLIESKIKEHYDLVIKKDAIQTLAKF